MGLVYLTPNGLLHKLAYLMSYIRDALFGSAMVPKPRPTTMSWWELCYKIVLNFLAAIFTFVVVVGVSLASGALLGQLLSRFPELRWLFGAVLVLAILYRAWESLRIKKRLRSIKKRLRVIWRRLNDPLHRIT
ncbi:MAG: hypothetical protein JWO50_828 [Candidatus Kaiserbacteria bacterium]|nr:hypothetical protein [Candidatus Kaiserbacteria bacterium]